MKLACLVLAAGAGSRFGGRKQLAMLAGKPLLQRVLERLQPLFGEDLYCVVGAYADQVRPLAEPWAQVIEHPAWAQGMGSSISHGVTSITRQAGYEGILVTLGDQVALETDDYRRLVAGFHGDWIIAAGYAGRAAVPALFPAACFVDLLQLNGDIGARQVLHRHAQRLITLPLPRAAIDIDTPADLRRYG